MNTIEQRDAGKREHARRTIAFVVCWSARWECASESPTALHRAGALGAMMQLRRVAPVPSTLSILTYHHIAEDDPAIRYDPGRRRRDAGAVSPPDGDCSRATARRSAIDELVARARRCAAAEEPGDGDVRRRLPVVPRHRAADPARGRRAARCSSSRRRSSPSAGSTGGSGSRSSLEHGARARRATLTLSARRSSSTRATRRARARSPTSSRTRAALDLERFLDELVARVRRRVERRDRARARRRSGDDVGPGPRARARRHGRRVALAPPPRAADARSPRRSQDELAGSRARSRGAARPAGARDRVSGRPPDRARSARSATRSTPPATRSACHERERRDADLAGALAQMIPTDPLRRPPAVDRPRDVATRCSSRRSPCRGSRI